MAGTCLDLRFAVSACRNANLICSSAYLDCIEPLGTLEECHHEYGHIRS